MFRTLRPVLPLLALVPVCLVGGAAALAAPQTPAPPPLLGFSAERAATQRDLEARFDAVLRAENLRTWMQRLTAHPHHLGSPWGKQNAEFMAGLLRSWGYDVAIEEFQVLFPTPKTRRLELLAPTRFTATLTEPAIAEDSTSGQLSEALPPYNAYSIDGDVTGELVFVNYGVPADYEELARRGVDVRGKIVIARYGGSWRGIKPKVAAEHGAIGCIIYSDPREDGYTQGDPYPKGGWRPEQGTQRGSVADMPFYPGDPLTPGVGATRDAKRLARSEAQTLTKIPVLPISWADALPLLQALGGPLAPDGWRGALPTAYHLGPGPARVHLQLAFDWNQVTAYDVIAKLQGSRYPDQWVIRGNHHDAWVHGASDPTSGMVALLEEARAVGELAKSGWRPQRTIVYAGWDGEEPGLLGSTEWAEAHAAELRDKAVAYVNSDSNARGFLGVGGSHTLEAFVNEVARDVPDPEKGVSVGERLRAATIVTGSPDPDQLRELRDQRTFRIDPLGSGSDFTPFLQHLGIASLNIGYGGEEEYGQYHSLYDSFDHYVRFVDPDFSYGVALAKTGGRFVLRLSEAEVLPFELGRFAKTVGRYVDEVVQLADTLRAAAEERSRRLADRTYELADDPKSTLVPPKALDPVPFVNLAPLRNGAEALERSTRAWQKALDARGTDKPLSTAEAEQLNAILLKAERSLTRKEGLPRRPWFRHQIYAPGFYTGYGVKTLAPVREALEQRSWKEAEEQAVILGKVLEGFALEVDRATAVVK